MEELLLGSLLARNELYVVENQHVNITKAALELVHSIPSE